MGVTPYHFVIGMPRLCITAKLGADDRNGSFASLRYTRAARGEAKTALLEGYGDMGRRHWSQTLDFYHLYFVLELWCWIAQIGNKERLDKLALDLERFSMM
jgi:hypothetical protein